MNKIWREKWNYEVGKKVKCSHCGHIPISILNSDYNLIIAKNGTCFYNGQPMYEEEIIWNEKTWNGS